MRINTNIASLNAREANTNTNLKLTNALEKLSSGLRINKSADDASGLAIADKLRTQATSVGQGIANGNSAIALLQIADKSMAEQSNILDTVKAKLIQANTDTTSDAGREAIRKDISKLLSQLDNIASQTNYNGKSLLADVEDGILTGKETKTLSFQIGAAITDIVSTAAINASTTALGGGDSKISTIKENSTELLQNLPGGELTLQASGTGVAFDVTASGNLGTITAQEELKFIVDPGDTQLIAQLKGLADATFVQDTTYANVFTLSDAASIDLFKVDFPSVQITGAADNSGFTTDAETLKVTNNDFANKVGVTLTQEIGEGERTIVSSNNTQVPLDFQSTGTSFNATVTGNLGTITVGTVDIDIETSNTENANALQKLIDDGDTTISRNGDKFTFTAAGVYNLAGIDFKDARIEATGVTALTSVFSSDSSSDIMITNNNSEKLRLEGIDASSAENLSTLKDLQENELTRKVASDFQSVVDDAITQLNAFRGDIGSTQNQVESAVRNLATQETNLKAAESIIRDVDYAAESANFNTQNIIAQAGTFAMSQANQVQQNVLRLLQ
jgi:flagellin